MVTSTSTTPSTFPGVTHCKIEEDTNVAAVTVALKRQETSRWRDDSTSKYAPCISAYVPVQYSVHAAPSPAPATVHRAQAPGAGRAAAARRPRAMPRAHGARAQHAAPPLALRGPFLVKRCGIKKICDLSVSPTRAFRLATYCYYTPQLFSCVELYSRARSRRLNSEAPSTPTHQNPQARHSSSVCVL